MELDDRMKMYERFETGRKLIPKLPIVIRLDGRSFHSFCKDLMRPFDKRLSSLMIDVTKYLVRETNALIGYTQSDEITLVLFSDNLESQVYFNGKIFKIVSILAAIASVKFNSLLPDYLPEKAEKLPVFDCRVWSVPSKEEAINCLIWREQDATKNSIQMAARCYYSHKELHKKSTKAMQEMLHQKGINWNDYPIFFKRGTYIQRRKVMRKFTTLELNKLPPKHEVHTNPELEVKRIEVRVLEIPPLMKVVNKVEVIFEGVTPITEEI